MGPRDFAIDAAENGSRLETYLRKHLGLTRPVALKALRKGWVRVDGARVKGSHRLVTGQMVRITNYGLPLPNVDRPPETPEAPPALVQRARDAIVSQTDDYVVAHKPTGEVVHAGTGHQAGWSDALGAALGEPLIPVGRLDRDTSGLLILARGRGASRPLFAALKAGDLHRTYQALVLGTPEPPAGLIDQPLKKQGPIGQEQMRPDPTGQQARTRYATVSRHGPATLLEVTLETGRTHQIRAHLAAQGHPLLGDPRYVSPEQRRLSEQIGLGRLFLHAGRLTLHETTFDDPLPSDLLRALAQLDRG